MPYRCTECGDIVPTTNEPPMECLNCKNDEWEEVDDDAGAEVDGTTAD